MPKSVIMNDLERQNGPYFAFLPNLVVYGARCVKVPDKAITMDNLRLLCLVKNDCRGTARRPRYEYSIPTSCIVQCRELRPYAEELDNN